MEDENKKDIDNAIVITKSKKYKEAESSKPTESMASKSKGVGGENIFQPREKKDG